MFLSFFPTVRNEFRPTFRPNHVASGLRRAGTTKEPPVALAGAAGSGGWRAELKRRPLSRLRERFRDWDGCVGWWWDLGHTVSGRGDERGDGWKPSPRVWDGTTPWATCEKSRRFRPFWSRRDRTRSAVRSAPYRDIHHELVRWMVRGGPSALCSKHASFLNGSFFKGGHRLWSKELFWCSLFGDSLPTQWGEGGCGMRPGQTWGDARARVSESEQLETAAGPSGDRSWDPKKRWERMTPMGVVIQPSIGCRLFLACDSKSGHWMRLQGPAVLRLLMAFSRAEGVFGRVTIQAKRGTLWADHMEVDRMVPVPFRRRLFFWRKRDAIHFHVAHVMFYFFFIYQGP